VGASRNSLSGLSRIAKVAAMYLARVSDRGIDLALI
jgi:hypothetical protein